MDLSGFRYGGANVTTFQLVNPNLESVQSLQQEWSRLVSASRLPFDLKLKVRSLRRQTKKTRRICNECLGRFSCICLYTDGESYHAACMQGFNENMALSELRPKKKNTFFRSVHLSVSIERPRSKLLRDDELVTRAQIQNHSERTDIETSQLGTCDMGCMQASTSLLGEGGK